MRFENEKMFYGIEGNVDFALSGEMNFNGATCADGFADAPYFCTQTAIARIRGIVGTDLQGSAYEIFGSLGYAVMFGQGAIGPGGETDAGSVGGLTYGIGVQRSMSSGAMVRAEIIQDQLGSIITMPDGSFAPTWSATSFAVSYVLKF
jgi:hypothetical protein